MPEQHFINHEEVHACLELWCNEASTLFMRLVDQLEDIEQRLANVEARVSEWEVGPK